MVTDDPETVRTVRAAAGVVLLGLAGISPWLFGAAPPLWRLSLFLGVYSLVALWFAHTVLTRRLCCSITPVSVCLLGLVLLTAVQLLPLPVGVVRVLAPARADWHLTLLPETPELLPGESESDRPRRSSWLPLTAAQAETEDLLAALVAVLLVYLVARDFVAASDPRALRQLAWVALAAGSGLAVLALAQHLSGERSRTYWRFELTRDAFGPFANKNHFAFQLNLFIGLAAGLFLSIARRPGGWRTPAGLGLLGGLGLMVASVAFSQSRGGVLSACTAAGVVALVARVGKPHGPTHSRNGAGWVLAGGVAVTAGLLIAWFGWHTVADRMATLWGGNADNRTADWRSVWPLVERFPLTGVGGGGLFWTEPTVRTRVGLGYEFNTLDNEYLEALVEGGVCRFVPTLGLAVAAVWGAAAGYRRTGDPLYLGAAFGLLAVAIHSAGDFGLHTPSVALAATVVAAFSAARRTPASGVTLTGRSAYAAAGFLVLVSVVAVVVGWQGYRAATHREASAAATRSVAGKRWGLGIWHLEAAARARPNDPAVWQQLMFAHLAEAVEREQAAAMAVAGPVALLTRHELPASGDADGHVTAALRAARAGRACQPLNPTFHLVLGTFAGTFARSEPAAVHLGRAKSVAAFDSGMWYATGRACARRGEWSAAAADWRESLARSNRYLTRIVRSAAAHLTPDEIRSGLLPDDPAVWSEATPAVFPDRSDPRRPNWLRATADRWATGADPANLSGFVGWATVLEELGDTPGAIRVWRRAVERFPEEGAPRDRLARTLEADESYEEAVPHLEWLAARDATRGGYRERLAAARHALKLKADINGP